MLRSLGLVVALFGVAHHVQAQVHGARSESYLFLTGAWDARALWINPAGLAVLPEASIMGEFRIDREETDGDVRLGQWSVGFNSRGFSVGYQRDRFGNDVAGGTLRAGLGIPFSRGALGAALTWYRGTGDNASDLDLGVLVTPIRNVRVGATLRHIGRPAVRDSLLPISIAGGASWTVLGGKVVTTGEVRAAERRVPDESGFEMGYRGGGQLTLGRQFPVTILATVDLGSNGKVDRFNLGIGLGALYRLVGVATTVSREGSPELGSVSLTGVASNLLVGR